MTEVNEALNLGWPEKPLAQLGARVTSGSRGWAKYYSMRGDLFVRITNLRRSSTRLDLSSPRYVQIDPDDAEARRTRLRPGDILVSITADIGIIGLIDETTPDPAYINQHIARVRLDPKLADSRFISYYLASWAPQRRFVGATDQGAKAGLNLTAVANLTAVVPPLNEQVAIADALDASVEQIEVLERLIAKKRDVKQGMMQELLTGRTRLPGFADAWCRRTFGDLLAYRQPTKHLVTDTEYIESGTPVLTAGKTFILGYTPEDHGIFSDLPVVIFDDFTTDSKYVEFPFKAKSSAMKMLIPKVGTDLRWAYERMQITDFVAVDHKRRWISEYSKIEIDVPTFEEQKAIAAVSVDAEAEIDALERRLESARAVKTGMMQELLTGRTRLPVKEEA